MKNIVLIMLFLFIINVATAENVTKDVSVEILLDSELNISENYDKILIIKNNDDEIGVDDNLELNIEYNITNETNEIIYFTINKSINYYSKSGFGEIKINNSGNFTMCANATPLNYDDYNLTNNYVCKILTVLGKITSNTTNITNQTNTTNSTNTTTIFNQTNTSICDTKLYINSNKEIYELGETIYFNFNYENKSENKLTIEYWVEDTLGVVVKSKLNTSSSADKRFTPSFSIEEKSFLLKANFANCTNKSSKLVVVINNNTEIKEEFLEIQGPEEFDADEIPIFTITGYKGNSAKTLVTIFIRKDEKIYSEKSKVYVQTKNTEYKFKIPLILKTNEIESGDYFVYAEGLGMNDSFNVNINEIEREIEEVIPSTATINPSIESFYTRDKNFKETINLYLKLSGYKNTELKILTENEEKTIIPNETNVKTNITIKTDNQIIISELYYYDELVSTKILKLNLTNTNKEIILTNNNSIQTSLNEKNITKAPIITGNAVIETESVELEQTRFPYEFLGLGIVILLIFRLEIVKLAKKTKLFK